MEKEPFIPMNDAIEHFTLYTAPLSAIKKEYQEDYEGCAEEDGNCGYCGTSILSTFKYCPECGRKIVPERVSAWGSDIDDFVDAEFEQFCEDEMLNFFENQLGASSRYLCVVNAWTWQNKPGFRIVKDIRGVFDFNGDDVSFDYVAPNEFRIASHDNPTGANYFVFPISEADAETIDELDTKEQFEYIEKLLPKEAK